MFALHCISIQESVMGFQPYGKDRRCRCCEHWGGDVPGTGHAVCLRFTHKQIQTFGKRGCAFWVRAIGFDEEPTSARRTSDYAFSISISGMRWPGLSRRGLNRRDTACGPS
jgi:hypothetical protein